MGLVPAVTSDFRPAQPWSMVRTRPERMKREASLDEAMDRYAQGDSAAFSLLYAGLELKLRSFLIRLTGAPLLAADMLQETFMRMHRARGSFERGAAVVPWAYAIARNVWLDHVRASKSRNQVSDAKDESPASAPFGGAATGPDADSEQLAIARETATLVEAVLARLPAAQREAFVLLRYEGMSLVEAAEVLGSTKTAVKLRAFRAYEALRAALNQKRQPQDGSDGS